MQRVWLPRRLLPRNHTCATSHVRDPTLEKVRSSFLNDGTVFSINKCMLSRKKKMAQLEKEKELSPGAT